MCSGALRAQESDEATFEFDIPSQPAYLALAEFAEQADLTVAFPGELLQGKTANELIGKHTLQEGIDILLTGTGLTPTFSNEIVLSIAVDQALAGGGKRMEPSRRTGLLAALAGIFAGGAAAQNAAPDEQAEAQRPLEEIVVTASKRETPLMQTPIPVTVVNADVLEKARIMDVTTLGKQVPNLQVEDNVQAERGSLNLSMRGISSSNSSETGDPNVGFHVDGIYVSRPNAVGMLMFDLERIEVLRGPQGTTFGRNSTIGAINVITAKPQLGILGGRVEAEYGRFNDQVLRGVLNIPIGSDVAVRLTAMQQSRDTYQETVINDLSEVDPWMADPFGGFPDWLGVDDPSFTGVGLPTPDRSDHFSRQAYREYGASFGGSIEDYGSLDHWAYRIGASWQITDTLRWDISYEDYQNDAPWAAGSVVCEADLCGKYPVYRGREENSGPYRPRVNAPGFLDQSNDMLRSVVEFDVPRLLSVKWNYGDLRYRHDLFLDVSNGTGEFDSYFDEEWRTDSRSHEIQFTSTHGGPVTWIAGYFNFEETTSLALASIFQPFGWNGFLVEDLKSQSEAVYADLHFAIGDSWEVVVGGRRTWDERTGGDSETFSSFASNRIYPEFLPDSTPVYPSQDTILLTDWLTYANMPGNWWENARPVAESDDFLGEPFFYDPFVLVPAEGTETEFSYDDYKIGINYKLNDDVFLFTSFATGHKAGGSSRGSTFVQRLGRSLPHTYAPEEVEDVELGVKAYLFDDSLRLQANYFNARMIDKQEQAQFDFGDLYCDLNGDLDHADPGEREPGCGADGPLIVDIPPQTPPDPLPPGHTADDYLFRNQIQSQIVTNAAEIDFSGIEVDFNWQITEGDELSGYATWLDNNIQGWATDDLYHSVTRYHGVSEGLFRNVPLDGNSYDFAPEYSLTVNYSHTFFLSNGGTVTPWISVTYYDDYYLTPFNYGRITLDENGDPIRDYGLSTGGVPVARAGEVTQLGDDFVDAHATADFSLTWESPDGAWTASIWVTNVTDEAVQTGLAPSYALPRLYGGSVGYSFGE